MIFYTVFVFYFYVNLRVLGQQACQGRNYTLDSCNGRILSNKDIFMDFGNIKGQCSCTVEANENIQSLFVLYVVPLNEICGTAIRFTQSDNRSQSLHCTLNKEKYPSIRVFRNLPITIQLSREGQSYEGDDNFCIRIYTNSENPVTAFCGESTTIVSTNPDRKDNISSARKLLNRSMSESQSQSEKSAENATNLPVKMTAYQNQRPSTPRSRKDRSFFSFDGTVLSMLIPLAIFVVISVILFILTVYLYVKLKSRRKYMNGKEKKREETDTENYTELGLGNIAAEPENPYEPLPRPET